MESDAKVAAAPLDESAAGGPVQRLDRCAGLPYSSGEYFRRILWRLIQVSVFRWSPARAFGWRKLLLRMLGARLNGKVFVRRSVDIIHPWLLEMEDWSVL